MKLDSITILCMPPLIWGVTRGHNDWSVFVVVCQLARTIMGQLSNKKEHHTFRFMRQNVMIA